MKKIISFICLIFCTLIWGTTFIAQDTGMDNIGPFTFNSVRFFVGFLAVTPFVFLFEKKKINHQIKNKTKEFSKLIFPVGIFLFLGCIFQQVALLHTDVANAAFFTVFYVPLVPLLLFFMYSQKVHWSIWPSIGLCVYGVYLLSNFSDAEIMKGDALVILCSLFWAFHIIFAGKFMKVFDIPMFYAALQAIFVATLSIISAYTFEDVVLSNILLESSSIIYAGVLSGGIAFTLQMFAQKNIEEAPAAIIYSLEGVFAVIAAWIILDQILDIDNIIGCILILMAVIFSQLAPEINKTKYKL